MSYIDDENEREERKMFLATILMGSAVSIAQTTNPQSEEIAIKRIVRIANAIADEAMKEKGK